MSVRELESELRHIEADRLYMELKLREAAGRQRIKCVHCGKYTEVKDIEVIATSWFNENVGCPAGTGRIHFACYHYVCPKCDQANEANARFDEIAKKYLSSFKKVTNEST